MNNAFQPAIDAIKEQIAQKEAAFLAEIRPLKETANQLCRLSSIPEVYAIESNDEAATAGRRGLKFREDEFFNKPLAGSVVVYLESRDRVGLERPASIEEIFDGLVSGGFKFEGATGNPENSKRALKTALTKNTAQFVKIGEKFALKKWYGMRSARRVSGSSADPGEAGAEPMETIDAAAVIPLLSADSNPPAEDDLS